MQINNHKVSVVMSVFNGEKYLDESVQSILNQTFSDFEFIIINDGSTDSSFEILKKYKLIDDRIILISRKNKGLILSLNEGIAIAKGKYIARMDADDISHKDRLEKQFAFLEDHPEIGVCGTWVNVFGKNRRQQKWRLPIADDMLRALLIFSVPVAHPTAMIRKEIVDKNNLIYKIGYENAEDYKFWLDLSHYTQFANIPEYLLSYRYHNESISRVADSKKDDERFQIISLINEEALNGLYLIRTNHEKRLHFIIASNERLMNSDFSLYKIAVYLFKIKQANKLYKCYSEKSLNKILYKKFFVCFFQLIKKQVIVFGSKFSFFS